MSTNSHSIRSLIAFFTIFPKSDKRTCVGVSMNAAKRGCKSYSIHPSKCIAVWPVAWKTVEMRFPSWITPFDGLVFWKTPQESLLKMEDQESSQAKPLSN